MVEKGTNDDWLVVKLGVWEGSDDGTMLDGPTVDGSVNES